VVLSGKPKGNPVRQRCERLAEAALSRSRWRFARLDDIAAGIDLRDVRLSRWISKGPSTFAVCACVSGNEQDRIADIQRSAYGGGDDRFLSDLGHSEKGCPLVGSRATKRIRLSACTHGHSSL